MATLTVAQALLSNATNLTVADSAATIAANLGNSSLTSRVSLFEMSSSGSVTAVQAAALAAIGNRFSTNSFRLTVSDSVAQLTAAGNATGLTIPGEIVAVSDTATNILNSIGVAVIHNAASIALTANATLSLSQLLTLEGFASFSATGLTLTLADTAANLLAFTAGEARPFLTVFQLTSSATVTAAQAATLAAMAHFSIATNATLTVADTIANVVNAGSALTSLTTMPHTAFTFVDTAANLLAQAATFHFSAYPGATVSAVGNATVTAAQGATLAALPHFSMAASTLTISDTVANIGALTGALSPLMIIPGTAFNFTDSAANLLAQAATFRFTIYPGESITIPTNTTVNATQGATLSGLPNIGAAVGATLTISDSIANISNATSGLTHLMQIPRTGFNFNDTLANVVAQATTFHFTIYPGASVTLSTSGTITAAQAVSLAALPSLHVAGGQTLTIADTASNLAALSTPQGAISQASTLLGNDTANATQLGNLSRLPGFTRGTGHTLVVTDTVANLTSLTTPQRALATSTTVDDTVTNLLAAQTAQSTVLSGATAIIAELDGSTLSAAQATSLASLAAHATLALHPNTGHTALIVSDIAPNVTGAAASLATLEGDGSVTVISTSVLNATAAAALVQASGSTQTGTLTVSDSGSALSAVASQVFGHGFAAIDVASGTLAGTMAQLLDPTLHFLASSLAQLSASATPTAAQAIALAALPSFSRAGSVTITVQDHAANLIANEATIAGVATSVSVTDFPSVSAASATTLAQLQSAVGGSHFSLGGNTLTILDSAQDLLTQASAGALALASAVKLSSDARISAASATQLAAIGAKLSPNGFFISIADSASNLAGLALVPATLTLISGWGGEAVLSANASGVNAATLGQLLTLNGFNVGTHTLGASDTAANLLLSANAAALALATSVQLSQAATVTAGGAASLAALHNFTAGNLLTIDDTPLALLGMSNAVAALASNAGLTAETQGNSSGYSLNAAQFNTLLMLPQFSLTGFTGGLVTISDNAASLLALAPTLNGLASGVRAHIATVLATTGNGSVSVAQYQSLLALPGFSGSGATLTVSDNPTNLLALVNATTSLLSNIIMTAGGAAITAANAQSLTALPNLLTAGGNLAINDSAANILHITGNATLPDDWNGDLLAQSITLNGDAQVTAAQAALLIQLGFRISNGGHALTIQDTPTALAALANTIGPISSQVTSTVLGSAGGSAHWSISLATASQLGALPSFGVGTSGVIIADTVANLTSGANATLIASITSGTQGTTFTLAGNDTATASQAETLHSRLGTAFSRGTLTLTILDGAGNLAGLDAASAALASAIQLQGSTVTSVANYQKLAVLPNFSDNGKVLVVDDTSSNLLNLIGGSNNLSFASEIMLSTSATSLSAMTAEQLATLPNFTTGIASMGIVDMAANLLRISGNGTLPDDWAGELAANSVTLNNPATVTAAQAALFAMLGSHFHLGGNTLTVSDSAANILSAANANGIALAGVVLLAGDEASLTAAQATQLAAITGFGKAGFHVTVSDSAAAIGLAGNATGIALADHVQLASATSLSVAAAEALINLANFQVNAGAPLTILDTLPNLLTIAGVTLAHNNSTLHSTPIELAANATATVAQMQTLAGLSQSFSENGFTITVADSGVNIAGFTPGSAAVHAYTMVGDATLTAAQADTLATLGVSLSAYHLTVADSPAALLDSADNAGGLALATTVTLSGATSIDAADAQALVAIPHFATFGQSFTVTGSASALLGLNAATKQAATTLALSEGGDIIDVASLVSFAQLGGKFSRAGLSLIVADNAANLETLNNLDLPLVSGQQLNQTATLDAADATILAALPALSLGNGVHLIVQDTAANLIALPNAVLLVATTEQLASGAVTLTVAQAAALAGLPHFSTVDGAVITVADSIANLNNAGTTGWHNVAALYDVTDSISELLANASTNLLTNAHEVQLLGDAQVTVANFDELVAIPNFSRGTNSLTVIDGPAAIAADATRILASASAAEISTATPISAAQAEELAPLNTAAMLSFASGVHLALQDSFANLSSGSNAAGVALASAITVVDVASQLAAATAFDWGSVSPFYVMSAGGSVTGAGATALAGVGGHFSTNNFSLTVADNAAGVAANTAALHTLGIQAQVSDLIAGVDAHTAALLTLGASLQSVSITDTATVTAAAAAGLAGLAGKLAGNSIAVADTAAAVNGNLANLETLGSHLGPVAISDSVTDVVGVASAIAALGNKLQISLSDATPITLGADLVAGLAPVAGALTTGTLVSVSDLGTAIAADATNLATLGNKLGTVTLSDGTTTTAATAVALLPVVQHLGNGVKLLIVDSATDIANNTTGLATLQTDGRLAGILASDDSATNVLAEASQLATAGATATIHDTAANVSAHLDALQALVGGVLTGITLSDGGTPDIALTVGQLGTDSGVLGLISSLFHYAVSGTSSAIAGDLGGGGSQILGHLAAVDSITVTGGTLTIPASTLQANNVDNGAGSALTKLTNGTLITATGVTITDFAAITLLTVAPDHFAVADDGGSIGNDIAQGGGSALLGHRTSITGIMPSSAISLSYAEATAQYVDDGAGSLFSKMPGATLEVTGVLVTNLAVVFGLPVAPSSITVVDSAGAIQGDLVLAQPVLLHDLTQIASITVSPGGTITLTANEALAAGMDDGADSVFGKMSGGVLWVTGATVDQLDSLHGRFQIPASVAVSDEAGTIGTDLMRGAASRLEIYAGGMATGLAVSNGPVVLDDSYVAAVASALALLPASSLEVTDVPVGDIATIAALGMLQTMTVSDTAAEIRIDILRNGSSEIAQHHALISSVAMTGGPISLSDAQVQAASGNALSLLPTAGLTVTGVAVADIANIAALGALSSMTVTDAAASLVTDLQLGSSNSELDLHAAKIAAVSVSDTDPVSAAIAAGLAPLLGKLTGPTISVSDSAAAVNTNLAGLLTMGAHIGSVLIDDTASGVASVAAAIAALGATLQITLSDSPAVVLSADTAADLVPVVAELAQGTMVNVLDTGSAIAGDATALVQLGDVLNVVTLSDSTTTTAAIAAGLGAIANHFTMSVIIDVADNAAAILANATGLGTLKSENRLGTLTAANDTAANVGDAAATLATLGATATVLDTAAHVGAHLDALQTLVGGVLTAVTLSDGGTPDIALNIGQFTADAGVLGLIAGTFHYAVTDASGTIATDLAAAAGSQLLIHRTSIDSITVTGGTLSVSAATMRVANVDDGGASVLARLANGMQVAATAVAINDFTPLAGLTVQPVSYAVADSGDNIAGDLELGASDSALLQHRTAITSIAPSNTVTLDYTTATTLHVNDGAGSVFSRMLSVTLDVTDAPATNAALTSLFATGVAPTSITVTDTAAHIATALETASPALLTFRGSISGVTVSPGGSVTLDADHALVGGVDNGASSIFGKMSGGTLAVTGALVSQLDSLHGLSLVPASVLVTDQASAIQQDLQLGASSRLETYVVDGMVTGVTVNNGPISLDDSYVVPAIAAALAALPASSLQVSGVLVADIAAVAGLGALQNMLVQDDVANIKTDLLLGAGSALAMHSGAIFEVGVTGGRISLTDAQAQTVEAAAYNTLPSSSVQITGVLVADVANFAETINPLYGMFVSGTAASITTDLQKGAISSDLNAFAASIRSITATDTTVSLSDTQAFAVKPALALFVPGSLIVTGVSFAHISTYTAFTGLASMTVADTSGTVTGDLTGGHSVLETDALAGTITAITVNDAPVDLSDSQAMLVLDALRVLGGTGGLVVSDVSVQDLPTIAAVSAISSLTVNDNATDVANDLLNNLTSQIYLERSLITGMTVTDGTVDLPYADLSSVQAAALAKLPSNTLVVDDVPVNQVGAMVSFPGLFHMTVRDTANAVRTDIASGGDHVLETNHLKISGITATGGTVTLSDADASQALPALALLTGSNVLVVTAVPVADITDYTGLGALAHMAVSDSDTNLLNDLSNSGSTLEQYASLISGITFSSGGSVTLTGTEAAAVMDALAEMPAASVIVTGALESQVSALGALASLQSMTISDDAGNIQTDLAAGATSSIEAHIGKITGIAFSSGSAVSLAYSAASQVLSALGALPNGSVTVGNVPAANVSDIFGLGAKLSSMTVRDTAGDIQGNLTGGTSIASAIGKITSITVSDSNTISLTDAQADGVSTVLGKLSSGSLVVSGVPAGADVTSFFALGAILSGMAVRDTAGNIQTDLIAGTSLQAAVSKISGVTFSSGSSITLTDGQAQAALATLAKLPASSLTVSGVSVTDLAGIVALTALAGMTVSDTAGNLHGDLIDAVGNTSILVNNIAKVTGITATGTISLTDAQADAAFVALQKLGSNQVSVGAGGTVPVNDVAHIASLGAALSGMVVQDSSGNVLSDLTTGTVLATNVAKITSITVTGGDVTLTDTQAEAVLTVLGKMGASSLIVTGVSAADVANIAPLGSLLSMTVADTGNAIQTDLAQGGSSQILNAIASITTVTATDASLLAATAAAIYGAVSTKFNESALVIADSASNLLAIFGGANEAVLAAAATVQLSVNAVGLTAAQATSLAGILHGTASAFTVNIADTAVNLFASGNAVGLALATSIDVSDSATNIQSNAPALIALEPKLTAATITGGGTLSASALSNLLALPNLSAAGLTISDIGSQIAAAISANDGTGIAFLNAHNVQLSANSVIAASDALALGQLSALNKNSFTLNVSDTATHLIDTADGFLAAVSNTALIDGVYLKTTGGTVTVTAATAAALTTIPNFHKNPVSGVGSNIVIVQDTAAHLEASYATLHGNLALFDHIYVSASATVTDAVYGDLLNLAAHPATGSVTLTVRDTATNISANAVAQLAGTPSITPIAWQLSGSSPVTETQAAVLGGLTGFSAGAFSLTLSGSATNVTVSDANALGVLGSAFHLGGFTVSVPGSVTALSQLHAAALLVVVPQIQDTFAHIVQQLTSSSPLLSGTMQVTDSEAILVSQAVSFFSLVKAGSGAGIPAANISFTGGAQAITDTLSDVQNLTGTSNWTSNAGLHTDFHLVVADTVATLINPSNLTALTAMYGTTLSASQPAVTAQALETLFTLESTINFSLGGAQITIQDSAANLLNPTYIDAIGMATQITLPGPDTVNTAGAETLMATGKLSLSGSTILTITDTSSDLLDGVLGTAISNGHFTSDVQVTLSDSETLDANTAQALVSLPGFVDHGALSIADDSSYLLNAANLTAENVASNVTLAGDETVSASTAARLAALPHFGLDGSTLFLASDDFANAATLRAIADFGGGFDSNGNSLTMTQDAIALTPVEYTALQVDNVVQNGHALSAMPVGAVVTSSGGNVFITATGITGATLNVYAHGGASLGTSTLGSSAISVTQAEAGAGGAVVITETMPSQTNAVGESAPIIAIDQTIITSDAGAASFSSTGGAGMVQVANNEYMHLYTLGAQPGSPVNPVFVYDPSGHTLSFDVGNSSVVLVTLGAQTHPASLDPSEIFVTHFA